MSLSRLTLDSIESIKVIDHCNGFDGDCKVLVDTEFFKAYCLGTTSELKRPVPDYSSGNDANNTLEVGVEDSDMPDRGTVAEIHWTAPTDSDDWFVSAVGGRYSLTVFFYHQSLFRQPAQSFNHVKTNKFPSKYPEEGMTPQTA